jgi:hypothetical protein
LRLAVGTGTILCDSFTDLLRPSAECLDYLRVAA